MQFTTSRDFKQDLWDYISTEFMQENPVPVIITDQNFQPLLWKNVGVPTNALFQELSPENQKKLENLMKTMVQMPLTDDGRISGYAYYSKPISFA